MHCNLYFIILSKDMMYYLDIPVWYSRCLVTGGENLYRTVKPWVAKEKSCSILLINIHTSDIQALSPKLLIMCFVLIK